MQDANVDRIWMFDRPSDRVQVTAAEIRFSDAAKIDVGQLPDDAANGRELRSRVKIT